MISDIYNQFKLNSISERSIVDACLTEAAVFIYPYMLMLRHTSRPAEEHLVENLRILLFTARNKWSSNLISKAEVSSIVSQVIMLATTQSTMLGESSDRQWECAIFTGWINDLSEMSNALTDQD